MSNDYAERQAAKNAAYAKEVDDLLKSGHLSPEVRAAMVVDSRTRRVGIGASLTDSHKGEDVGSLPIGYSPDIAEAVDSMADKLAEEFDLTPGQAAGIARWHQERVAEESMRDKAIALARLTGCLFDSGNLALDRHALAYATHSASSNGLKSMRVEAPKLMNEKGKPCTVAALSKRASFYCGFLGLPPGEGMKSEAAVQAYRDSARKKHWRKGAARVDRALERLNIKSPGGEKGEHE